MVASREIPVSFENVGMRYGQNSEVLSNLNFHLEAGSFHYLVGPSGAGKTSLLRLLYLSHLPSRGVLYLFNKDVTTLTRPERLIIRNKIGVVFQDFRLINHFTVAENVALPLRLQREAGLSELSERKIEERVNQFLDWSKLDLYRSSFPLHLSGGQQQIVAICRAVITSPQLLLADEPTGNVDDGMALRLLHLFEGMHERWNTTVLIATHATHLRKNFPHPVIRLDKSRAQKILIDT